LWAWNQQFNKILLVLVVVVSYVQFTTPMTFSVLSTLTPKIPFVFMTNFCSF
jgi:hypothetical protein